VLEEYPKLEPYIEDILPKKEQLDLVKLYVSSPPPLYYSLPKPHIHEHQHSNVHNTIANSTTVLDPTAYPSTPFTTHPSSSNTWTTLVHKYPFAFHRLRIDRGAIRFVLSGATLMAPGLTSPGGRLPGPELEVEDREKYGEEDLKEGQVVIIEAEGKDTACMVGVLKMGTGEMKKVKKGQACEAGHYLGDGLWELKLN
jgi:PUA domain protein